MGASVSPGTVAALGSLLRLDLRWEGDTALGGRGDGIWPLPLVPGQLRVTGNLKDFQNEGNLG